ncbi:MAG: Na+/H+ antiporter NhaA [Rhodospirillales bacterium]
MPVIREFLRMEAAGGIVLLVASLLAIIVANSAFAPFYTNLLHTHVAFRLGGWSLDKSLHHWVNDGLMTVFFLLVGLEIKREFLVGELSSRAQAILPFIAAFAGMVAPAALFVAINAGQGDYLYGWAIPAATDIAFALTVLSLLGNRIPLSLKVFLTAVAVIDDLGAIVIIAVFYSSQLSLLSLALAAAALVALILLNAYRVERLTPYVIAGFFLWICVLQSGVHATLAGVAIAAAIPLQTQGHGMPLLTRCEHALHPWVAFVILPVFGFANAGVLFAGMGWDILTDRLTLGIAIGLFVGKQIGIFGATWGSVRCGLARVPEGATWAQVYGVALLCGIGFTMSLFIGGLAWPHTDYDAQVRLAVILGSLVSALVGVIVLTLTRPPPPRR